MEILSKCIGKVGNLFFANVGKSFKLQSIMNAVKRKSNKLRHKLTSQSIEIYNRKESIIGM